eukprot:g24025.t1
MGLGQPLGRETQRAERVGDLLALSPELLLLARQFFALHALLGLLGLLVEALAQTVTLAGLWNVAFPVTGMHFARENGGTNRAVRWLALARLWCWLHVQQTSSVQFYLNIVIESGKEHWLSRATASTIRSTRSTSTFADDKYASRLAESVENMIRDKLRDEAAIMAKAKKHFQRGNLIVVLVSIERIDMRKMLELKGEQHRLRRVDLIMKCLRFIPIPLKFDVEEVLLTQLCRNMIGNVPSQLTRQMCEIGGVNVDVEAKSKDQQADYLLEAMRQLDEEDIQEAKNRRSYAFGGDEVWPFFCGYGHAKVRHVPTTACYPRQITCSISPNIQFRQIESVRTLTSGRKVQSPGRDTRPALSAETRSREAKAEIQWLHDEQRARAAQHAEHASELSGRNGRELPRPREPTPFERGDAGSDRSFPLPDHHNVHEATSPSSFIARTPPLSPVKERGETPYRIACQ